MPYLTPVTDPITLTDREITQHQKDGFLVFDDVFPPQDIELLRKLCESPEIREQIRKKEHETRTVHLLELTSKHPTFLELACSPRIIERIKPLIGPDIQLQHSNLATTPPVKNRGPFPWHQDFAYLPHTNTDLLAVMVMLDDATPENGCMQMVPGSHKLGLLDHAVDGVFQGACQESHLWEDQNDLALVTPKTGGISIHHCLMLHGSEVNLSGKPRRGIVFQYRADDAYQLADTVFVDTGTLICGQKREHARCEGGAFRLPKRPNRQPPFGNAWNQEGELAQKGN